MRINRAVGTFLYKLFQITNYFHVIGICYIDSEVLTNQDTLKGFLLIAISKKVTFMLVWHIIFYSVALFYFILHSIVVQKKFFQYGLFWIQCDHSTSQHFNKMEPHKLTREYLSVPSNTKTSMAHITNFDKARNFVDII